MRRIWLVADDYGLAPGVCDAIIDLIERGRLSGTGCMPLYADWHDQALRLRPHFGDTAIGLHLTLTDQPALSGASMLAPGGKLPGLGRLIAGIATGTASDRDIHAEMDAQYARFVEAMDAPPAYLDGHQHVHFLPPVRRWLRKHALRSATPLPWLRGAPRRPRLHSPLAAKIGTVRTLASRFDASMAGAGYSVVGPLSGFYDWTRPDGFEPALTLALRDLPDGGLFMCHPGNVDDVLMTRDPFTWQRKAEYALLRSKKFADLLDANAMKLTRP